MVRVLDADPALGRYLSERAWALARSAAIAPIHWFDEGPTSCLIDKPAIHTHLGLLVLDGVIVRNISFGQLGASEFFGPGDLLRPWVHRSETAEVVTVRWEVLARARVAELDEDFANRVRAWPEIPAALLDRSAERADSQALQAALQQARSVEDRVLLALWHFAGRWGQIGPEGRVVDVRNITGELLGRFVGSRRQSVSTALGQLATRGAVERHADGRIVLPLPPPQLERIDPGRRASDRKPRLRERG